MKPSASRIGLLALGGVGLAGDRLGLGREHRGDPVAQRRLARPLGRRSRRTTRPCRPGRRRLARSPRVEHDQRRPGERGVELHLADDRDRSRVVSRPRPGCASPTDSPDSFSVADSRPRPRPAPAVPARRPGAARGRRGGRRRPRWVPRRCGPPCPSLPTRIDRTLQVGVGPRDAVDPAQGVDQADAAAARAGHPAARADRAATPRTDDVQRPVRPGRRSCRTSR